MTAVAAFLLGAFLMWLVYRVRRANDRMNWILRGVAQAEREHGWHEPVDGEPAFTRIPRRRSPNEQFVSRSMPQSRSILDDQSR